nr:hypothetical protein CFP56_73286 [Quercus suber]
MEVEIGNPWVLDYGFGWRWRWRWLGLVGEVGFFWVSMEWAVAVEIGVVVEKETMMTTDHATGCGSC